VVENYPRMAAAYTLLPSLLVIAIAVTHHDAIAFLIYAILCLALALVVQVARNRRQAA